MPQIKILVIDDSIVIRKRISEMLANTKAKIIEAQDGIEGLELLAKEQPNFIVLDFLMPNTSGWEVYQKIQENTQYSLIPLVLMSGRKEEVTDKISEPFELFSFLEKPFGKQELFNSLNQARSKADKRKTKRAIPQPQKNETTINEKVIQLEKTVALLTKQVAALEEQIEILRSKEQIT